MLQDRKSKKNISMLIMVVILLGLALWQILPINQKLLGSNGLTLGLDLRGGSQLLYRADLSKKDPDISNDVALNSVVEKIQRRVNEYGATEPVIQIMGADRILVQLPGIKDINKAIELIGDTGQLYFVEQELDSEGAPVLDEEGKWVFKEEPAEAENKNGTVKALTGEYLKRAYQDIDPYQGPVVVLEWDSEGSYLFEKLTEANLYKPLAIVIDGNIISMPIVQSVITSGTPGRIEGNFTIEEARNLTIQLNSGALDVPLDLIDQRDVDASLGSDSIKKSILAAQIGLILLLLFMIIYYRLPGVVACLSLFIYGVLLLAVFKIFSSSLTLTLPGIAAAILSLGMAVDANVLIFERMKEELRLGRNLSLAVETGFNRAWPAIRDSNITTFIACIVLFWLGGTFGAFMVRGFALTLFTGVALSMFTAIVITRTLLRFIVNNSALTDIKIYGIDK